MALPTTVVNPNQTLAAGGLEGAATNVVTAVYWNRAMALLHYLAGTGGYIGCRAIMSGSQSVANATATAVAYPAESFDSDPNGAIHDNVTNNTRLTIRTAGVYTVTAYGTWAANATGIRNLYVRINGGAILAVDTRMTVTSGDTTDQGVTCQYFFAASDFIDVVVYQSSGGALGLTGGALSAVKA